MFRQSVRAEFQTLEARQLMVAGALDETFSSNGKLTTDYDALPNSAVAVTALANLTILVAGSVSSQDSVDIMLVRYLPDGTIDSTFGIGGPEGDGVVVQDLDSFDDIVTSMVVQADGKILVAGQTSKQLVRRAFVVRFNKDGSLDTGFGDNGVALPNFGAPGSIINDIAIQTDGAIVAVGTVPPATGNDNRIGVARLTAGGAADFTFAGNGINVLQAGSNFDRGNGIALQNNGKIVICGRGDSNSASNDTDMIVFRFKKDGSLDDTFNGNGKAFLGVNLVDEAANDVIILPSGVIAVCGKSGNSGAIWSLRPGGDSNATAGFSSQPSGDEFAYEALALRPDGFVEAVGTRRANNSVYGIATLCAMNAGAAVLSANAAVTFTDNEQDRSFANAVAIQRNGQIVVAGVEDPTSTTVSTADFGVARLNAFSDDAGSISGKVFEDRNGNGIRNKKDKGVGGVRVYLDINSNNALDETEPSTLSYPNGIYTIPGLFPGDQPYRVREILPKRFARTTPVKPATHIVNLTSGQHRRKIDFGNRPLGIISGTVFEDADFNFQRDDDEDGLANFIVFIDANEDGILDDDEISVTTDADGNWKFKELASGTYIVRVQLQDGFVATIGPDRQVELQAGGLSKGTLMGLNQTV